jgi:hypothetical protein
MLWALKVEIGMERTNGHMLHGEAKRNLLIITGNECMQISS